MSNVIWDNLGTPSPPVTGSPLTNDVPVWSGTQWVPQKLLDASIAAGAAIAYSKLALALSIVNGDISAAAAIARSKLDFGAGLVNADIAAAAAIAYSKLALSASVKNADLIGSGGVLADTPPGRELTYNEFTANVSLVGHTEATATTIVTASAFTFDGSTPIVIHFWCPFIQSDTASGLVQLALYDGASSVGILSNWISPAANSQTPGVHVMRRMIPAAASKTYSIRGFTSGTSTGTAAAQAGGVGNLMPGFIRIVKA